MIRMIWVYTNALFYILMRLFTIRKHYKHPERYTKQERFDVLRRTAQIVVKRTGCPVTVIGTEHIPDGQPVLYVANHASMIDPYFCSAGISKPTGAIIAGDDGYEKIPVIAPWLLSVGSVFIDRQNPRKALKGIKQAVQNVKDGNSLLLFPEGEITRFVDPTVKVAPFQTGALKIATKAKVPIIPIAISGTNKVFKPRSVFGRIRKHPVKLNFLEPYTKHLESDIPIQEMANELRELLIEHVENEIEE